MGITNRDLVGNISGNKNITVTIPIFSLSLCDSQHKLFKLKPEIQSINTRTKSNLHQPTKKEHIISELRCSIVY